MLLEKNTSIIDAVASANQGFKETGVSRERCWGGGKLKPVELRCFPAAFLILSSLVQLNCGEGLKPLASSTPRNSAGA